MCAMQVKCHTFRLVNAFVTIHEFSAGTAILNIVSKKEPMNRASIWVDLAELDGLAEFIAKSKEVLR